jgi:ParB family transcriptional regulator, chromosome partitioning protein
MAKAKGLGRGLDALLGDDEREVPGEALRSIPIGDLEPGKYQPRWRPTSESLSELAESIKSQGVMQPVLARPLAGGRYEIIAGERRWRAARMAGLTSVPALVRDMPDQQALAAALVENMQREDLNALEEAAGIQRLTQDFGLTHQRVAEILGRSRAAVTNLVRLLELAPAVRELLAQGSLDMGHARALLALPPLQQVELARAAVDKQWSVRDVERRVTDAIKRSSGPTAARRVDRDVARLEDDLSSRLGTEVRIKARGKTGGGRLVIEYRTLDQLQGLIEKLGGA